MNIIDTLYVGDTSNNGQMNTEEGWEITSSENSEPEGACMENETTMEVRRNGLQFIYNFSWKTKFEWLLQYDFVRLLYDRSYFERFLEKAQEGGANAQTLVGCCYGHNGKMAADVVTHNIEEALKWWHLAAEQGHKYASTFAARLRGAATHKQNIMKIFA